MSPANKAIDCATVGGIADNNISGEGTANNTQKSFNSIILPHPYKLGFGATHWPSLKRIVRTVFVQIEIQTDGKTDCQIFAEL